LRTLIENEVAEGWYVEFKEMLPSSKKIGHSIAAFANSDGGWLIFGIKANNKNIAIEIVGIDIKENENICDKLRDIIKNNIKPVPYFKIKIVNISSNKLVVLVNVKKAMKLHM